MSERRPGEVLEEAARILREQLSIAAARAARVMAEINAAAKKEADQ